MVNRIHTDTARSPQSSNNSSRDGQERRASSKAIFVDDVITSLANAHENRRARQVTEWQQLGAKTVRAAA